LGKNIELIISTALYDFNGSYGVINALFVDFSFRKVGRRSSRWSIAVGIWINGTIKDFSFRFHISDFGRKWLSWRSAPFSCAILIASNSFDC
jgi:hypothetical protein